MLSTGKEALTKGHKHGCETRNAPCCAVIPCSETRDVSAPSALELAGVHSVSSARCIHPYRPSHHPPAKMRLCRWPVAMTCPCPCVHVHVTLHASLRTLQYFLVRCTHGASTLSCLRRRAVCCRFPAPPARRPTTRVATRRSHDSQHGRQLDRGARRRCGIAAAVAPPYAALWA